MNRILLLAFLLAGLAALAVAVWVGGGAPGTAPAPPRELAGRGARLPATGVPDAGQEQAAQAEAAREVLREPVPHRELAPAADDNAGEEQGVTGRVADADGRPLPGVRAWLVESADHDPIGRMLALAQDVPMPPAAACETDAGGTFRLGLREATGRTFEVHLLGDGFASERLGGLRIHAGEWLDLGAVTLARGATIRGRVTVADTGPPEVALPVPNATVTLDTGDPFLDLGAADLPGWRGARTAQVDAGGNYELQHAPRDGLFRLTASAPGFARQTVEQVEITGGRPVTVDFELPPGLSITGVLETGGRPVARARIEVWSQRPEPAHFGVLASGDSFRVDGLAAGSYLLRIQADGFQPVERTEVPAGTEDLRIELSARGSASVAVRAPEGHLLRRYRLSVRRWFPDQGGEIAAVADVPDRSIRLEPPADRAEVLGLDDGTYVFQVLASGYAATLSEPFTIDAARREASLEMTLDRGGSLRGRVVDALGDPVAGAVVATQPDGYAGDHPMWRMVAGLLPDRITRARATTGPDGSFALAGLAHAGYQLEVTHPDFCRSVRRGIAVQSDELRQIEPVALERGAVVRGRAYLDGVPAPRVRVVLVAAEALQQGPGGVVPSRESADETSLFRVEAVSDNSGGFMLPVRVPPGNYVLQGGHTKTGADGADFLQLLQMKHSIRNLTIHRGQELAEEDVRISTHH